MWNATASCGSSLARTKPPSKGANPVGRGPRDIVLEGDDPELLELNVTCTSRLAELRFAAHTGLSIDVP
jgi:hypothetical protein